MCILINFNLKTNQEDCIWGDLYAKKPITFSITLKNKSAISEYVKFWYKS